MRTYPQGMTTTTSQSLQRPDASLEEVFFQVVEGDEEANGGSGAHRESP